jgi:hypothetical protein
VKKTKDEVCRYWPNSSCAGRVVGYTVIESQEDDKVVPLCFAHFNDTQLDNLAYRKRKHSEIRSAAVEI